VWYTDFRGHAGFTLTILSLTSITYGIKSSWWVTLIILSTAFSLIPDVDLRLEIPHRKYTHNVFFILMLSIAFGILTAYVISDFTLGFLAIFIGGLLHILGDLLTYMSFCPLCPIYRKSLALKLFRSNNSLVNNALLVVGISTFVVYNTTL